jgi:hypothetical protein
LSANHQPQNKNLMARPEYGSSDLSPRSSISWLILSAIADVTSMMPGGPD